MPPRVGRTVRRELCTTRVEVAGVARSVCDDSMLLLSMLFGTPCALDAPPLRNHRRRARQSLLRSSLRLKVRLAFARGF